MTEPSDIARKWAQEGDGRDCTPPSTRAVIIQSAIDEATAELRARAEKAEADCTILREAIATVLKAADSYGEMKIRAFERRILEEALGNTTKSLDTAAAP